ncbi:MAG: epoxyqueuosine reductase [Clostridiales bacterium]|jgi:epoxyqueuosine reductase|nr:epoxyqueuosine reductase [Clostridiales bacterium]MDK2933752.1 epoxyqueuosine reductase [Clostridiales bacterium]
MKEKLKEICKFSGIEYVGIAPPGPYLELEKILENRIAQRYYTGLEETDLRRRIDPSLIMEDVQSIIVCLFPYFIGHVQDSNISKYTYSLDYHVIIKEKLEKVGKLLSEHIENFYYQSFVDNGPLVDRYLAYLAGLGYWGVNNNIITDKYGSYVFIGYMLNNYPFEFDTPLDKTCIQCGTCVKRCPGAAILGNFEIDPKRCVSYITQKKDEFSRQDIDILRNNQKVFGCDICQDVCPHNNKAVFTNMKEFKKNLMYNLNHKEIQSMSNREFKRKYGNRAFSWRGKKVILRNFEVLNLKN